MGVAGADYELGIFGLIVGVMRLWFHASNTIMFFGDYWQSIVIGVYFGDVPRNWCVFAHDFLSVGGSRGSVLQNFLFWLRVVTGGASVALSAVRLFPVRGIREAAGITKADPI